MQAILKNNHKKFLEWVGDVKLKRPPLFDKLSLMEDRLQCVYETYQEKLQELKLISEEYEQRQKEIKNEIKKKMNYARKNVFSVKDL